MDRAIGDAIFEGVVPTGVLGVAAPCHRAVIADVRKSVAAAGGIVLEHGISAERTLAAEGQSAELFGGNTAIDFVVERLASAGAINGVGISGTGKTIVDGLRGGSVGEQARLWIDAGGSVEDNGPARKKLFPAADAETGLLKVVGRDNETMLIAVAVDERRTFIVVTVFRKAVADPANANVIGTVEGDAVPSKSAIGGGEFVATGAGIGRAVLHADVEGGVAADGQSDFHVLFIGGEI